MKHFEWLSCVEYGATREQVIATLPFTNQIDEDGDPEAPKGSVRSLVGGISPFEDTSELTVTFTRKGLVKAAELNGSYDTFTLANEALKAKHHTMCTAHGQPIWNDRFQRHATGPGFDWAGAGWRLPSSTLSIYGRAFVDGQSSSVTGSYARARLEFRYP